MKQFTDSIFQSEISSGTVAVDFYADWCRPCTLLAPIFEKVSATLVNAKFGKLDIENNPETSVKYNISSLPTIIIFKDGKAVEKLSGLVNEKKLTDTVQKHI
jgi:thioredoxin 1